MADKLSPTLLDAKSLRSFTLPQHKDKTGAPLPNSPKWICKVLSLRESLPLEDMKFRLHTDGSIEQRFSVTRYAYLKAGLRGGNNLLGREGGKVSYVCDASGEPTDDLLDLLDWDELEDVADFIESRCKLTETEKNES